jgi:hypothetical protein
MMGLPWNSVLCSRANLEVIARYNFKPTRILEMETIAFPRQFALDSNRHPSAKCIDQPISVMGIKLHANPPQAAFDRRFNSCTAVKRVWVFADLSNNSLDLGVGLGLSSGEHSSYLLKNCAISRSKT